MSRPPNSGDYAAVIMAANYTSVRLRWTRGGSHSANPQVAIRATPTVRFFPRDMAIRQRHQGGAMPRSVAPDSLDRTSSPAAGSSATRWSFPTSSTRAPISARPGRPQRYGHVVPDGDLVTTRPPSTTAAVRLGAGGRRNSRRHLNPPAHVRRPGSQPAPETPPTPVTPGKRRILMVVSEWGYWGEELVGPLGEFDRVGYEVEFCTATGRRPPVIPVSADPDFFDPPLQRSVTTPEMAARVREFDDPSTAQGKRLDNPVNLAAWMPERPYFASPQFVRQLEDYNFKLVEAQPRIDRYDAILIVGGSGPIVDLANNQRLHDLILAFLRAGKPVAAECYGVTCLAFARDMNREAKHHSRQARHWPLSRVRLQGWDGLYAASQRTPGLRHGSAALPARIHPARCDRTRWRLPRQFRASDQRYRRLSIHYRSVDAGQHSDRPETDRGAGRQSSVARWGW